MRLSIFLCIIFIFSCKESNQKNILPEEKMQSVLWKLIKADVYVTDFVNKDSSHDASSINNELQNQIFAKEGINRKQFEESFNYYTDHPELFKNIFDTILKRNNKEKRRWSDTIKILRDE
ncbi:MAG: DUF4296 domain-containing protein [Bacteroidetes bacterium]|nr:DUF4296 domain-containing protein [Bacteroidota bacterium]